MTIGSQGPARDPRRGLTLGEMLIVLAVFLILAAMFMFSSKDVIFKTLYSTTLSEQKTIDEAITRFELDNTLPPSEDQGLDSLQRPREFMAAIPMDAFSKRAGRPRLYQYYRDVSPQNRWMLVSVGPDGIADVESAIEALREGQVSLSGSSSGWQNPLFKDQKLFESFLIEHAYDPTNGSDSAGDVIRPHMH